MNKVILLGHLGHDPELKNTQNGNSVANFSLATTERWMDKAGAKQEKTEWHRIVVWGTQATNCAKYLAKGSQALVEGKLQTRTWEDKDGTKRYTTEVVAQNVRFLGKPKSSGTQEMYGQDYGDNSPSDDIPF